MKELFYFAHVYGFFIISIFLLLSLLKKTEKIHIGNLILIIITTLSIIISLYSWTWIENDSVNRNCTSGECGAYIVFFMPLIFIVLPIILIGEFILSALSVAKLMKLINDNS